MIGLTTTQRGLGAPHQRRRRVLLAQHVEGVPCAVCGRPMYRHQGLDADHSVERAVVGAHHAVADRLLHAPCNRGRWQRRRARTGVVTRSRRW